MKILFFTILKIDDISDRGVYPDLMRKFVKEGHEVFVVTPAERRTKRKTALVRKDRAAILKVRMFNYQKASLIEKWMAILFINRQYLKGIQRFFPEVRFDLVIYSTPPITFTRLVRFIKHKHNAVSYLLLKDIFPQNAVDLKMIKKGGLIHHLYERKEKELYEVSDFIGCMSQANVDYIRTHHPALDPGKIEINPNSHELFEETITSGQKRHVRNRYNIPVNATVFIYGGNLGKPQGVDFVIELLQIQQQKTGVFFVIAGSGTEYGRIKTWMDLTRPGNMILLTSLPKQAYNHLLQSCDVGMIFLDPRFTIPNFPSRLLSYLEYKLPVVASTDDHTDIGSIMTENQFGLWSLSGDLKAADQNIDKLAQNAEMRRKMGQNGHDFFKKHYTVDHSYDVIMKHCKTNDQSQGNGSSQNLLNDQNAIHRTLS